ncbi:EAL domain-containing protein [Pleionea sp. CnH1-48]|uniref:sensor domain-containing protein n=1 Tax=Pleionea sp. CnH1-48 TaxID=2954494 RepID=UPI0020969524|nr:EAL domain-containing protein [Pleionea sp. CnH1-48]MCO7222722.1 EAL domain-containing protein [Pleionea sp. CnH1-48]
MSRKNDQIPAEQLLRIVLDAIPLRVFWKDVDLNYLGANQKLLDDIGFKQLDDLIGQSDYAIYDTPEEAEPKRDDDREVMRTGQPKLDIEEPLPIPGKKLKWLRTNKVPMKTPSGEVIGILGTYQDITEEVEYRHLIERQALIDPLTGLANRRCLQTQILESKCEFGGLLFIDLDRFKQVNDSLGHSVGDNLLQLIASNFQEVADKHNALLARLGGDEFSIYKTFETASNIEDSLESIAQDVLNTLNKPIKLKNHVVTIGASVGIATILEASRSSQDSFAEADLAMYSAKLGGQNKYQFFTEELRISAHRQHKLYSCLQHALAQDEFYLMYQPQFDSNQNLIGTEALIRWKSAELGEVSPVEFIPIAEETGMIHEIGDWVIREALDSLQNWTALLANNPNFKLAINVSSSQFENKQLPLYIKGQLLIRSLNPGNLELEITESLLLDHKKSAVEAMEELKRIGVTIAIDDFGTGYSSLSYLATLPLNKLKIDRSFVTDLHNNSTNKKLVEAIVNLASGLDLNVIAEGVETLEEKSTLENLSCFSFQGYFFAKPLSLLEFEQSHNGFAGSCRA